MGTTLESDEQATEFIKNILNLYFFTPGNFTAEFITTMGSPLICHWAYVKQGAAEAKPDAVLIGNLGKITANVLLISGRDDFICGVQESEAAREGIGAKAKHVIYEDCGHMPWIENKDESFKDLMGLLLQ